MATYTLREKVSEDDVRIVWYVEGLDGDGEKFTGKEIELKQPQPEQVLGDRIDANLDTLRDGIVAFDDLTVAQRWALVKLALRILLALARLYRGRQEVDG